MCLVGCNEGDDVHRVDSIGLQAFLVGGGAGGVPMDLGLEGPLSGLILRGSPGGETKRKEEREARL